MIAFEVELTAFRRRLEAAGLGRFADALIQMAKPSIRLVADAALEADRPGATRLGGAPDLPPQFSWPRNDGAPLSFIAQVNLADVTPYDAEGLLPKSGLLSFFYDAVTQAAWGFDPADHGSARVIYTPPDVHLEPRDPPNDLAAEGVFRSLSLTPVAELTFAPWESFDVESLGLSRDERFAYAELFETEDSTLHRLLGQPDAVQGDMQLECQLVTNGLYCGDSSGYEHPRVGQLQGGSAEWRLLLQIDS